MNDVLVNCYNASPWQPTFIF